MAKQKTSRQGGTSQSSASQPVLVKDMQSFFTRDRNVQQLYSNYVREFSSLTAENLIFYLEGARKGINFFKAFLFEEIKRRDLHFGGIIEKRRLNSLHHNWHIVDDAAQAGSTQVNPMVQFVQDNFKRIQIGQLMCDIVGAQIDGVNVFNIEYEVLNNLFYFKEIETIPNYLLVYDNGQQNIVDLAKTNASQLRAQMQTEHPTIPYIAIDPIHLFDVYSFDGTEETGYLSGCIDSLIWAFYFKNYGLKDWSIYLERFALPGVVGKYDPLMSKPDRESFFKAVQDFGNMYRAIIPNTQSIDLINDSNKTASGDLFERYVNYWDGKSSVRVLGEAATTSVSDGGSYAKMMAGVKISEEKELADMILITYYMNKLIRKLVDINYPSTSFRTGYPRFEFVVSKDLISKEKSADVLVKLKLAGYGLELEDAKKLLDLPLVELEQTTTPFNEAKKNMIDKYIEDILTTETQRH